MGDLAAGGVPSDDDVLEVWVESFVSQQPLESVQGCVCQTACISACYMHVARMPSSKPDRNIRCARKQAVRQSTCHVGANRRDIL